jgi:hypothetical protein
LNAHPTSLDLSQASGRFAVSWFDPWISFTLRPRDRSFLHPSNQYLPHRSARHGRFLAQKAIFSSGLQPA